MRKCFSKFAKCCKKRKKENKTHPDNIIIKKSKVQNSFDGEKVLPSYNIFKKSFFRNIKII